VIDGSIAVLPADTANGSVAVLRLTSVVTTVIELFERIWPDAVPLAGDELPADTELSGREQELLRLLAHGATDEVAAAQLGISVRTVRRMVAQIMNRLGARSRFQAGVKAADRGWLLERAGGQAGAGDGVGPGSPRVIGVPTGSEELPRWPTETRKRRTQAST
jgi:DNA-binding CsgD family transcriptional regulator